MTLLSDWERMFAGLMACAFDIWTPRASRSRLFVRVSTRPGLAQG